MPSLKKITDMVVARALSDDDHFFADVNGIFSEVPISLLMNTLLRRVDFPKGYFDVSEDYAASECSEPIDYLFDLPAGNYILNDMAGESLLGTYQMSRFNGASGNVSRWFIITTDHTHIELYSSKYSNDDPLLWLDGKSKEFSFKGQSIVTKIDLDNAIRGIGITIVKESPESAELGANTYAATGDRLPVVVPASQTLDHRPVGKGSQIVFIPEHNNIGTDPMLTLNDGVAVPIRQRAAIDTQTADNTVQISANTLIQGMPYTLTFCGVAWLIDSYLPGEGSETTAKVTSVNNKTGAVKITASGIGAALASINWRSVTKSYQNAISNEENGYIDPKEFMLCFGQGCFFCRADNGQHFLVRTDIGRTTDSETGLTIPSGPSVVLYAHIPIAGSDETISGGLWLDNTQIVGVQSLNDLENLALTLNGSPILTVNDLTERLKGYVSNTALSLLLTAYPTKKEMSMELAEKLGKNDISDWAKQSTKPNYNASEIAYTGEINEEKPANLADAIGELINLINTKGSGDSGDWVDLTSAYAQWKDTNSDGTAEVFFSTITEPGVYALSDGRGYWYCCRIFEAVDQDDSEIYRLLLKMSSTETSVSVKLLNSGFEHKIEFASGITVPEPKNDYDASNKKYVDQKEASLNAKISARTTHAKAKEIANEEAARIVLEALPLSEMSTVSTRLQKYTEQSVRYIKIELLNKSFLESCYSGGHTVKLHFLMCSRKHGKGHHWWHPSNYNVDPEHGAPVRIGYGQLAGTWRDEKKTKAFPQVPSWMPNSGWVETEIKLTHNDLVYGYKLIDPTVYFLPMIKPSKINENNEWGQDIDFVSVQTTAANSGRRFMPILCTWVVAIDGIDVGRPLDVLRIGCTRDIGHHTMVKTEHGQTTLKNLFISIK